MFELEQEADSVAQPNQAIYVIYPEETANTWRVQAVPISPDSFESRKALPEAWRGLRDDELSKISGIDGSVFVHASGFIGGSSACHSCGRWLKQQPYREQNEGWCFTAGQEGIDVVDM